ADTQQKRPAFDHARLAAALSSAAGHPYTATTLPFNSFTFVDDERALEATFGGDSWRCGLAEYDCRKLDAPDRAGRRPGDRRRRVSPDKQWEALVNNFNLAIRRPGTSAVTLLTFDGSEGNAYALASMAWAPDSKKIAAYRVKPGYRRDVHYVESSPQDQVQP